MPVAAPTEGYMKMIAYGQHKSALRWDQLALQAFLAGFWVAIYGHACTYFASKFYKPGDAYSSGLVKLAYGALFPGAFVAVIYTGTELFTGNTVTMIMVLLNDGWKASKHLCRVWGVSLLGNLAGATFGAFLLTWSSRIFHPGSTESKFLFAMAKGKIENNFITNIVLGIGCNALVCCGTWCVVVSDDGAGKILAIFYTIGVFAMGGYEHIVANFYTLTAAHFCGYDEHNFGETLWRNWIPVLLGNLLAGTLFTGMMWWYALHPQYSDLAPFSNDELTRELSMRMSAAAFPKKQQSIERWQKAGKGSKSMSLFLTPHMVPGAPGGGPAPDTDYSMYISTAPPVRERTSTSLYQQAGPDGAPPPGRPTPRRGSDESNADVVLNAEPPGPSPLIRP